MAFGWGSDSNARHVDLTTLEARFKAAGISTDYYTPEVHRGAFALPPYVARLIT
jgi:spermidine synthase